MNIDALAQFRQDAGNTFPTASLELQLARWDITETRRLIELRHGNTQLHLARHCLRSVVERQVHARYHLQEAKCLMQTHIDDRLERQSIYDITLPIDPEAWGELTNCLMKVEANVIACSQSIHSLGDILAHVTYFVLGLNTGAKPLREDKVSLSSVIDAASPHPEWCEVVISLSSLVADSNYKAVEAYVNHSKHRGLIELCLSVEPAGSAAPYAMEFGTFSYREVAYARREITEVLGPAYEAVSRAVVDTGNALNCVLAL